MKGDRNLPKEDSAHWSVNHPAVWSETLPGSATAPLSVTLRHPGYPLTAMVARSGGFDALRAVANEYLKLVQPRILITDEVLQALIKDDRPEFGWLPVTWGPGALEQQRNPRGSFRVASELPSARPEHTLVLLAGYRMKDKTSAGGEVGLRVLMHVRSGPGNSRWAVLISGISTSRLPLGFKASKPLDPMGALLQSRIEAFANTLNFSQRSIDGMAYLDPTQDDSLRVFLSCSSPATDGRLPRNFRVVADFPSNGAEPIVRQRSERIAHAVAKVFEGDPASVSASVPPELEQRRPTRREANLGPLRINTLRVPSLLKRPGGAVEVRQTRLGNVNGDPSKVQTVTPVSLPLRSDKLAAAHAYLRGDELLRRLEAYGLLPGNYFKLIKQPLLLRHRAPLAGAGDGISVNAQVLPVGIGAGVYPQIAPQPIPGLMPELEVSFGWCDLAHRRRRRNDAGRLRAQPLGLTADARWAWHEFCHVLIFANLGELEFPFAHSAGDALAAIIADPDAKRVRHANERFITFPWVFTPRRHDRNAAAGWCWCGRRNLTRLARDGDNAPRERRLGYFEEQLMSTSLFRLYRCIGGDSGPVACRSAADYAVYLVMKAIQLLGLQQAVPAYTVNDFVNALMHADLTAGAWNINASWPEALSPRSVKRVGGCLHKVILWAFEQQGLNATADSTRTVEGPGLPPDVDIYIADRRIPGKGGYWPVPLDVPPGQTPDWHAADSGIALEQGRLVVRVRNRGQVTASDVQVACWVLKPGSTNPNNPAQWAPLPAASAAPIPTTVNLNSPAAFHFDPVLNGTPLTGPHLVKASATCPADRSNLDPMTTTPLTNVVTLLADLVANDNNIGLRVVTF